MRIVLIIVALCIQLPIKGICNVKPNNEDAVKYINSIASMQANFTEIQDNTNELQGKIWLMRGGMLRLEYESPRKVTLVKNRSIVSYYDHELNELSHIKDKGEILDLILGEPMGTATKVKRIDDHYVLSTRGSDSGEILIKLLWDAKSGFNIDSIHISDGDSQSVMKFSNIKLNEKLDNLLFSLKKEEDIHDIF